MSVSQQSTDDGLTVLGPDELGLVRAFEALILAWSGQVGAIERRYPFLLEPEFLDKIDYFANFPHLGLAVSTTNPERLTKALATSTRPLRALPTEALNDATYNLPSAACYSIYLNLRGQTTPERGSTHTTVATCFRNEERYEGLRRLLGFSMREIAFVGPPQGAQDHLIWAKETVLALAARLGLDMTMEVAVDPFFDKGGSRAKMAQLFPVKEEFIVGGLAVGSVNYHRNFFGQRCDISLPTGEPAHTSCLAFGLERWVHALTARFGDARSATEALWEVTR